MPKQDRECRDSAIEIHPNHNSHMRSLHLQHRNYINTRNYDDSRKRPLPAIGPPKSFTRALLPPPQKFQLMRCCPGNHTDTYYWTNHFLPLEKLQQLAWKFWILALPHLKNPAFPNFLCGYQASLWSALPFNVIKIIIIIIKYFHVSGIPIYMGRSAAVGTLKGGTGMATREEDLADPCEATARSTPPLPRHAIKRKS